MPSTLRKTSDLQQHPVLQALRTSFKRHVLSHGAVLGSDMLHNHEATKNTSTQRTLWLTCSGGRDSLGLAYALATAYQHGWLCEDLHTHGLSIKVIHVNHQMQSTAEAWQQHVEQFCEHQRLECISVPVQLAFDASEKQARNARFDAFYQHIHIDDILVLGHHADDQAETVLMNLCKGAGLSGLTGMQEFSHFERAAVAHWRWRPWLSVTREQITDFCTQAQLAFVDDPTNVAGDNSRAFIRREVMPLLEQKWHKAAANIARSASIVAESKHIVDVQVHTDLLHVVPQKAASQLVVSKLIRLPRERQHLVISRWLQAQEPYAPPQHLVLQIAKLAQAHQQDVADSKTRIAWQQCQVKRYDDTLYKLPLTIPVAQTQHISISANNIADTRIHTASGVWHACCLAEGLQTGFEQEDLCKNSHHGVHDTLQNNVHERASENYTLKKAGLSATLLDKQFVLRPVQAGERLHLYGRVGSWPVKKFFQSIRLPSWQRKQAQVLCLATHSPNQEQPVALLCAQGMFVLEGFHCTNLTAWGLFQ